TGPACRSGAEYPAAGCRGGRKAPRSERRRGSPEGTTSRSRPRTTAAVADAGGRMCPWRDSDRSAPHLRACRAPCGWLRAPRRIRPPDRPPSASVRRPASRLPRCGGGTDLRAGCNARRRFDPNRQQVVCAARPSFGPVRSQVFPHIARYVIKLTYRSMLTIGGRAAVTMSAIGSLLLAAGFALCGVAVAAAAERRSELIHYNDVQIDVVIDGSGPAVVLLPSLARDSDDYDEVAEGLAADGFRVLRPKPRGIGRSTGPMTGISL